MKNSKVEKYFIGTKQVKEKFKEYRIEKIRNEDLKQIKCDMGFWCQIVRVMGEGHLVERAKREMKELIGRLRERGWDEDTIYRRIIASIVVDETVKKVYNY